VAALSLPEPSCMAVLYGAKRVAIVMFDEVMSETQGSSSKM
jgi:hypothetical protein